MRPETRNTSETSGGEKEASSGLASRVSRPLPFTLKAWPVIALATIGLSFLTQYGAKLFGIELPEQTNIELVRQWGLHAFDSLKNFGTVAFLVAQVIVLMPAVEECVFRWGLFKIVARFTSRIRGKTVILSALLSSAIFSAAHYITQPWPDNAFLALFFFGLAQCWLYRKTDRLWCAMLNHALFNLTNLVLLFLVPAA